MIKSIELVDFLSHSDTNLEFKDGVTIFVGDKKSTSSIDLIMVFLRFEFFIIFYNHF